MTKRLEATQRDANILRLEIDSLVRKFQEKWKGAMFLYSLNGCFNKENKLAIYDDDLFNSCVWMDAVVERGSVESANPELIVG